MQIAAPCVVSLTWRLADAQGIEIDELVEPIEFFYGGDDLLAKVEEALAGEETGFETTLHLEPEHAFGEYDPELVFFESRALFPEAIEPACSSKARLPARRPPGLSRRRDLHRHRGLSRPRRARRQPSARRHRACASRSPCATCARRREEEIEAGSVGSSALSVLGGVPPGTRLH